MSPRLHVGRSPRPEPEQAAEEAVRQALQGAERPVAALVFCTDAYPPLLLAAALASRLGDLPWVGCSSAAVFAGGQVLQPGLVVGVLSSVGVRVGVGLAGPVSERPRAAGAEAAAQALGALPPARPGGGRALVILTDALRGNSDEVVRGAGLEGGALPTWAGGGVGSLMPTPRSAQFALGQVYSDRVVALALDAPGPFGVGIQHGWRPYGPPTLVTRSRGMVASELEYQSAFEAYRRVAASRGQSLTLEGFADFAMTHPLGIPLADGEFVIRDPLGVEPDGGLRCVGAVPDGSLVRIMEGDRVGLLAAARRAAEQAREQVAAPLAGAVVFDCISRYLLLGPGIADELANLQAGLGPEVPFLGCLTFGEVGALGSGVPQFHNKTAVVLAIPD